MAHIDPKIHILTSCSDVGAFLSHPDYSMWVVINSIGKSKVNYGNGGAKLQKSSKMS